MIGQISWSGKWNDRYTGKDVPLLLPVFSWNMFVVTFYCLNCVIAVFCEGIILLNLLFFNLQGQLLIQCQKVSSQIFYDF